MENKRVFVSGGAGVIGLEMIPRLLARGAKVLVGDLKPRPAGFAKEVRYRQGDLNLITKGELEAFAPDVFIHLAATFERSTETYGFWEENYWHNVRLSHHLMTIAKGVPSLKRVVFASSYLIYDQAQYQFDGPQTAPVSLRESAPVLPRNLTGMAKFAHEIELRFLDRFCAESFTTACARIYRGYGRNSRDVISRWVRALLAGESITVYRPEGMFDYVYAKDSAEGLIRLADADAVAGILNLGTGRARTVQDVVDILRTHFPNMKVREENSDIPFEASQADMTAYRKAVGWVPEYDLESGIQEVIAHEMGRLTASEVAAAPLGNVLVTCASRKIPLVRAVQKAARRVSPSSQVIAGDLDHNALARYVADGFWRTPRFDDAAIEVLVAGCKRRKIHVVIPTRDDELLFWSRNRERFAAEGVEVVVSPVESVETCRDKLAFAQFGLARGLPFVPAGLHPDEVGKGPYVAKERYGAGARSIGLNLDRAAALAHGARLEDAIYQPFLEGIEISIDAWATRSHQVKALVLRTRDLVLSGESQVTTTFRDTDIEAAIGVVVQALKVRGPVVVQAMVDLHKGIHVIECNTRFGGASTASIAAGLDVFYWSLLETSGADLGDYPFDRISGEVRQVRVPDDIHIYGSDF